MLGLRPHSSSLFGLVSPDAVWLSFVAIVADGSLSRPGYVAVQAIPADSSIKSKSAGSQVRNLRGRFIETQVPVITVRTKAEESNQPEKQDRQVDSTVNEPISK